MARPEGAIGPDTDPTTLGRQAFLEDELRRAYLGREEAKAGSQAEAAFSRRISQLFDELETLKHANRPTSGLDAVGILNAVQERARGLPEPVLAVFANEWARRHRLRWVSEEESTDGNASTGG